jgi:hypothetical protein
MGHVNRGCTRSSRISAYMPGMKKEPVYSSETPVTTYPNLQRHMTEDNSLHNALFAAYLGLPRWTTGLYFHIVHDWTLLKSVYPTFTTFYPSDVAIYTFFSYITSKQFFLSLVSWGRVRLSPFGTWPIVRASDDRWVWNSRWNENWQAKPMYSEKTCPNTTLSTTNPT